MSLKRVNYVCGHPSCDDKKCSVRLSRELTMAACHILEKGFHDAKRKERMKHMAASGEEVREPDLSSLDLPLIEDSGTKISISGLKHDTEENKEKDSRKRLKSKRDKQSSHHSDGQCSESSIKSGSSARTNSSGKSIPNGESRSKSIPRSMYGPGSNYMMGGSQDLHRKKPSGQLNPTKRESKVKEGRRSESEEERNAALSKLSNVYGGMYSGGTGPKGSTASTNLVTASFRKRQQLISRIRNPMEPPIIIESHRSHCRSILKKADKNAVSKLDMDKSISSSSSKYPEQYIIPESLDEMQVLFQFNSAKLSRPKLDVLDILAEPTKRKSGSNKLKQMVAEPASVVWGTSDSEGSSASTLYDEKIYGRLQEPQTQQQKQVKSLELSERTPRTANEYTDNNCDEFLVIMPEIPLATSDDEDTCPVIHQKKKSLSDTRKRSSGAFFPARVPLPTIRETLRTVHRNNSERKTMSLNPKPSLKYIDNPQSNAKTKTSAVSGAKVVSSRTPSFASKPETASNASMARNRSASTTPKVETDSNSSVARMRLTSTISKVPSGSTTGGTQSRTPSFASKVDCGSKTGGVQNRTLSTRSKIATDSSASMRSNRKASTSAKRSTDSNVRAVKSRTPSTSLKISTVSNTGGAQNRITSTTSKIAADSSASTVSNRRASTSSKISTDSNASMTRNRRPSTASKLSTDSSIRTEQARLGSSKKPTRIPIPASGPNPVGNRPTNATSVKLDTHKSTTASGSQGGVANETASNAKSIEQKKRPQTAILPNVESRRSSTATKMSLARPSSEKKPRSCPKHPSKTEHLGGGKLHVVVPLGQTLCNKKSSEITGSLSSFKASKSYPMSSNSKSRTIHTKSTFPNGSKEANNIDRSASGIEGASKGPALKVIHPKSKIPLPVKMGSRTESALITAHVNPSKPKLKLENMSTTLSDTDKDHSKSEPQDENTKPPIYNACEETAEDKKLTTSYKAGLLKMNSLLIKAGKIKPVREVRSGNTPIENKTTSFIKEVTEPTIAPTINERDISSEIPNVDVRKKISMFDTLLINESPIVSATKTAVQDDESEDDFLKLLDNIKHCHAAPKLQNTLTESFMDFIREDALKVAREFGGNGNNSSTECPEKIESKIGKITKRMYH